MHWLMLLVVCFAWVQVLGMVTTIYLHRGVTHGAIEMQPGFARFMRTLLWLGTDIVPKEWASVHRKHHAYADKPGDPHSPLIEGVPMGMYRIFPPRFRRWFSVSFRGVLRILRCNSIRYTTCARDPEVLRKFGADVLLTSMDRKRKRGMGIVWCLAVPILTLLHGPWGILEGLLIPVVTMILYIIMSACINGIAHVWGYQNDKKEENPKAVAYNSRLLAIFTGGEGLHNNHHWVKGNARFSQKWSEPDPGWWVIILLDKLSLVIIAHEQQMIFRQKKLKVVA